jgi:hypothetical protein
MAKRRYKYDGITPEFARERATIASRAAHLPRTHIGVLRRRAGELTPDDLAELRALAVDLGLFPCGCPLPDAGETVA